MGILNPHTLFPVIQIDRNNMDISVVLPQTLELSVPYDSAVPFLDSHSKDYISYMRDACSSMFIAVLLTIPRTLKHKNTENC